MKNSIGGDVVIRKIRNVTFLVSNLGESAAFYEKVLGLKKSVEWSNYVVFDVGGVDLGLSPGGKKGQKEGAPDIYLLVDDVDATYQELKSKGVKFVEEPEGQYWGARTAKFLDPDENAFILVQLKS